MTADRPEHVWVEDDRQLFERDEDDRYRQVECRTFARRDYFNRWRQRANLCRDESHQWTAWVSAGRLRRRDCEDCGCREYRRRGTIGGGPLPEDDDEAE